MSLSTCVAVVPFVMRSNIIFNINHIKINRKNFGKFAILYNPTLAFEDEIVNDEIDIDQNGWTMNPSEVVSYNGLFPRVWTKDKKKVFVINESDYANVGEMEMTFFSNSEQDLIDFIKEQNIDLKITTNQAIKQTT